MKSKGNTIFWAIIACLLWSTAYAGIKLGLQFDTPFHFEGFRFIIAGLMILSFPLQYWMILLWLSFMAAAAFSLWFKLLQRPGVKVSELNLWKFIIPVVGAILSWLLIPGEKPEWLTVSGMIVITVSLILFYRSSKEVSVVI